MHVAPSLASESSEAAAAATASGPARARGEIGILQHTPETRAWRDRSRSPDAPDGPSRLVGKGRVILDQIVAAEGAAAVPLLDAVGDALGVEHVLAR